MPRSVSYASGRPERLSPDDVTSVPAFTEYARQELGLSYPVGKGRREGWLKFCKEELSTQSWDLEDLVRAVQYIKRERRECRTLQGILYYVDEARASASNSQFQDDILDLHTKVSEALAIEEDESWRRRLALAKGKALERVYEQWKMERAEGHGAVEDHRDEHRLRGDVPVDGPLESSYRPDRRPGLQQVLGVLRVEEAT